MSRFYRGTSFNADPFKSEAEFQLYQLCVDGFDRGELLERPHVMGPMGDSVKILLSNDDGDPFFTYPDIYFPKADVPVYGDGPHHVRSVHWKRDQHINRKLIANGYVPLRFTFPANKSEMQQYYREICDTVNPRVEQFNRKIEEENRQVFDE